MDEMKKNLLTVLILALLIVNIVLTSVMMISVTGTNKKTASLVGNIASAMNLELTMPGQDGPAGAVSLADTEVHDLGKMTMLLKDGGYLVCTISLSVNTKHDDYSKYKDSVETSANVIKDSIGSVVLQYTSEDCSSNLETLKADILSSVQALFQSDFIYQVAVSEVQIGG